MKNINNNVIYERAIAAKEYLDKDAYGAMEYAIREAVSGERYDDPEIRDIISALSVSGVIIDSCHYEPVMSLQMASTRDVMDAIIEGRSDVEVYDSIINEVVKVTLEDVEAHETTEKWFLAAF